MAWLFLQENVQVQYLQKIAAQKIRFDQIFICLGVRMDFLHEVQFSAAIEAAHFPAVETGHWARSLLPFSPFFMKTIFTF